MIQVALFGIGRIGRLHAGNIPCFAKLKYIVDPHAPNVEQFAQSLGATATDTATALKDPEIQAVLICSSTDTHADLLLQASQAGKAIFCEKPIDLDIQRARHCEQAILDSGVLCMIGLQRRFDPTFSTLKKRLDAGEIGQPEMLLITSRDGFPPPLDYVKRSGGVFRDMLIHDFDIFRWILGDEAENVYATGSCLIIPEFQTAGDVDSTVVTIRTKSGLLCQISTSRRAEYGHDQRFEVLGSRGMLQAGNPRATEVIVATAYGVSTNPNEPYFLERYRVAYAAELKHFFEALRDGTPVRTTISDAIKAQELAEAATLSWQEKRVVFSEELKAA